MQQITRLFEIDWNVKVCHSYREAISVLATMKVMDMGL